MFAAQLGLRLRVARRIRYMRPRAHSNLHTLPNFANPKAHTFYNRMQRTRTLAVSLYQALAMHSLVAARLGMRLRVARRIRDMRQTSRFTLALRILTRRVRAFVASMRQVYYHTTILLCTHIRISVFLVMRRTLRSMRAVQILTWCVRVFVASLRQARQSSYPSY